MDTLRLFAQHVPRTQMHVFNEAGHYVFREHPDEFVCNLLDDTPELVCEAAKKQRATLKNPPKSVDGVFQVPTAPGIGITVDEAELAKRKRPI